MQNDETAKKEIINRNSSLTPRSALELFACKAKIIWSGGTLSWSFNSVKNQEFNFLSLHFSKQELQEILLSVNKIIYYYVLIMLILGFYRKYKVGKLSDNELIFINILILNLIVYSIIEVQERYIYLAQISIFILSSLGFDYIKKIKNENQNSVENKS